MTLVCVMRWRRQCECGVKNRWQARWNEMGRHPKFLTQGTSSLQFTSDIHEHRALRALVSIRPFQVRIKMRRHQARWSRSLLLDLPDLGQRLGTLTPCLLVLGVWPFHYTGSQRRQESGSRPPRAPLHRTYGTRGEGDDNVPDGVEVWELVPHDAVARELVDEPARHAEEEEGHAASYHVPLGPGSAPANGNFRSECVGGCGDSVLQALQNSDRVKFTSNECCVVISRFVPEQNLNLIFRG